MEALHLAIFHWFNSIQGVSALTDVVIVFFATYVPYALIIVFLFYAFAALKHIRARIFFFAETALALILGRGLITEGIRYFFPVLRPYAALGFEPLIEQGGFAFPSAHAAIFFALATLIARKNRAWGWVFFLGALLNGCARVAAGVHWPLDILGGAFVGIVSVVVVERLLASHREAIERLGIHRETV